MPNDRMSDTAIAGQTILGAEPFAAALQREAAVWQQEGRVGRLWGKDATLWTGTGESGWLGWLDIVAAQQARRGHFRALASLATRGDFTDAVVLGMGGSSLCPDVLSRSFGPVDGAPRLHVLDSTDPAQVARVQAEVDPERCLFIVASKSGNTLEPNIFYEYFYEQVARRLGDRAGEHFLAITDPGSKLEAIARRRRFQSVSLGVPSIGGRYSALSDFGLVPAAIMGLSVERLLARAAEMVTACGPDVPVTGNPGVLLGLALGVAGRAGRDKVTLVASEGVRTLGAWLEQLIAESTGKKGVGLIPVDRESLAAPGVYGDDRLFVSIRLASDDTAAQDEGVDAIEAAGHPVIRIRVRDHDDLAGEFFRWEIATAVAGAVLGINPFDQPDVEASKVATRALTDQFERQGSLPPEAPFVEADGLQWFADPVNRSALEAGGATSSEAVLGTHLKRLQAGDYCALLAYVDMNEVNEASLSRMRHTIRDTTRVATCVGFGPRFLHSTGQVYKGGPNSGVFLQVTADDARNLPIPGRRYSFGVVKEAQARGDFDVLAERQRRALRVHLEDDVAAGLATLERLVADALKSL